MLRLPDWAFHLIIGCLDDDPEKADRDVVQGVKVIGELKDLPEILQHNSVDELIFTPPDQDFQGTETAIALAEEQGLQCASFWMRLRLHTPLMADGENCIISQVSEISKKCAQLPTPKL